VTASSLTITTSSLVMNTTDWVVISSFQTCSNNSVQFLLHFCIAPLHCTKIQFCLVITLNLHIKY